MPIRISSAQLSSSYLILPRLIQTSQPNEHLEHTDHRIHHGGTAPLFPTSHHLLPVASGQVEKGSLGGICCGWKWALEERDFEDIRSKLQEREQGLRRLFTP